MMSDDKNTSVLLPPKNKATFRHLKPLSKYSHMVCHIMGDRKKRQRQDDSCLDDTYETPLKKTRLYESCSPDEGCVVDSFDFPSVVHESTAQPLRSKAVQPLTAVMSTPLSKSTQNRFLQARESLLSPIPVLKWDRDEVSLHASQYLDPRQSVNVSLSGYQGHVLIPIRITKRVDGTREAVDAEVVAVNEEGRSENQLSKSHLENEDSFETSLPLQVQVRSKVVVPDSMKMFCLSAERKQECDVCKRARCPIQRSAGFHGEENWKRAKNIYAGSIMRHMETNRMGDGVMTELMNLMNTVAGQRCGQRSGRDGHWQHPSDLTRRNYCFRGPMLSLSEWQKRNHLNFKRFASVPDIFHRSPVL